MTLSSVTTSAAGTSSDSSTASPSRRSSRSSVFRRSLSSRAAARNAGLASTSAARDAPPASSSCAITPTPPPTSSNVSLGPGTSRSASSNRFVAPNGPPRRYFLRFRRAMRSPKKSAVPQQFDPQFMSSSIAEGGSFAKHHRPRHADVGADERVTALLAGEYGHSVHRGLVGEKLQHDAPVRTRADHPLECAARTVAHEPAAERRRIARRLDVQPEDRGDRQRRQCDVPHSLERWLARVLHHVDRATEDVHRSAEQADPALEAVDDARAGERIVARSIIVEVVGVDRGDGDALTKPGDEDPLETAREVVPEVALERDVIGIAEQQEGAVWALGANQVAACAAHRRPADRERVAVAVELLEPRRRHHGLDVWNNRRAGDDGAVGRADAQLVPH